METSPTRRRWRPQALAIAALLLFSALGMQTAVSWIGWEPEEYVAVDFGPDLGGGFDMVALTEKPAIATEMWGEPCHGPSLIELPSAVRLLVSGWMNRDAAAVELETTLEAYGDVIYWRRVSFAEAAENRQFYRSWAVLSLSFVPLLAFYTRRRRELVAAYLAQLGAAGGTVWAVAASGTVFAASVMAATWAGLAAAAAVLLWLLGPRTKAKGVVARAVPLVLPIIPVGLWTLNTWTPWAYHLIPSVLIAIGFGLASASLGRLAGSILPNR